MGRFIPRGIEPHGGRGKAGWPILLTFALLVAAPVGAFAQSGDGTRTYYVPSRSFNIPFSFRGMENDPRIEVLLNVSTDGQLYRHVATAKPHEQRFFFPAPSDGLYTFIVQTRDASNALTPADLRNAAEKIRICVDTQKPVIEELTAVPGQDNSLPTIRWRITEDNLKEIWADYRPASSPEWMPLFLPVQKDGNHTWKPSWGGELEVRMQAVDKANNKSEIKTLRLRAADNVTRMPPPPDTAVAGKVMHVKSKTFQLQYTLDDQTVGPSQVERVDIWKIHPGQRWEKCKEKGNQQGAATVTVESSGRWGFRLIPRSGAGLAEPDPKPGDAPDIWVEVDDKKPQVTVTKVTVTQEPDGGYLTVYWTADDAFLRAMPITIYLASPQGGEWKKVASDLPNTGSWRQLTEVLEKGGYGFEFLVKVEAIDEAENTGEGKWRDVVKIDLRIPRIKDIKVNPGGAAASGGQDAYAPSRNNMNTPQPPLTSPSGQSFPPVLPSSSNGTNGGFSNPKR
jgi:hypothetical protein